MRVLSLWSDARNCRARHPLPPLLALVPVILLAGCELPSAPPWAVESCPLPVLEGRCWEFLGLEGKQVHSIAQAPMAIFVGTSDHHFPVAGGGFFRLDEGQRDWERLSDFDEVFVTPLHIEPEGAPPRLLVALSAHENQDVAPLLRSLDGGRTWVDSDRGWVRHDFPRTTTLAAEQGRGGRIFAGGRHAFMMSDDGGESWFTSSFSVGGLQIYPSPRLDGTVWSVHSPPLGSFYLSRSEDRGESWSHIVDSGQRPPHRIVQGGPREHTLWGISSSIVVSEDEGNSWSEVGQTEPISIDGGDIAVRGREVIVVAAEPVSGPYEDRPLIVQSTLDGEEWMMWKVPSEVGAPHRLVVTADGDLLIGTANGLWRVWELESRTGRRR